MKRTNNEGFTLIELLVVVLIIGILAAIALPQYQKAVEKSKYIDEIARFRHIYQAEKLHYLRTGSYEQSMENLDINWPAGTQYKKSNGEATLPNGEFFRYYSGTQVIQSAYKGVTVSLSLVTGTVDCYHFRDDAKKKTCQNIQRPGYTCSTNACTIISFGE